MDNDKKVLRFAGQIIEEGSWGSRVVGRASSVMTLKDEDLPPGVQPYIFWEIDYEDGGDYDEVFIGLEVVGNKVVGYEGVMGISSYALVLLRRNGYDTSEIE